MTLSQALALTPNIAFARLQQSRNAHGKTLRTGISAGFLLGMLASIGLLTLLIQALIQMRLPGDATSAKMRTVPGLAGT